LSRHIQQWRTLKNPISQGRLSSATVKNSFHIEILHSDGNFKELLNLLEKDQKFAILCPIGIISQLSRKENDAHNLVTRRKIRHFNTYAEQNRFVSR
jgi:hypothetical protein